MLMFYTATMLMEKRMKIFKGAAIGCLNSKYELCTLFMYMHSTLHIPELTVHTHFHKGPILCYCIPFWNKVWFLKSLVF